MIDKVLVVIPTYQESENIAQIIERTLKVDPNYEILVVDDSSPDGTANIVKKLIETNNRINILINPVKGGLGRAYLVGFGWGLARNYDIFVEMDADGSHAPEQIPQIVSKLLKTEVSLGSRWISGGRIENWPISRQILSRGGNLYTQLMLGIRVKDATGGFRAYRRRVLESIELETIESQGYCFQVDMVRRALANGFTISETPITFTERELGNSKMSRTIVLEAFTRIGYWGIKRLFRIQ